MSEKIARPICSARGGLARVRRVLLLGALPVARNLRLQVDASGLFVFLDPDRDLRYLRLDLRLFDSVSRLAQKSDQTVARPVFQFGELGPSALVRIVRDVKDCADHVWPPSGLSSDIRISNLNTIQLTRKVVLGSLPRLGFDSLVITKTTFEIEAKRNGDFHFSGVTINPEARQ